MKILVVCGSGLGSSFMLELNVKKAMKELGIDAEVTHTDLTTAKSEQADYYIGSGDIMDQLSGDHKTISLKNMFNMDELKQALQANIAEA
ncbi:PTS sugar transporter subunit IIB [Shimazuella kribbensis]|uniref:PTS sugar transporter subunit IIB n=1 Tax=Shimazuella kribbensis TaxID=139808 RepID=UPI0003F786AE|nr:PTS sugar transporter subunit IIB [Shimazuella kribbensis]